MLFINSTDGVREFSKVVDGAQERGEVLLSQTSRSMTTYHQNGTVTGGQGGSVEDGLRFRRNLETNCIAFLAIFQAVLKAVRFDNPRTFEQREERAWSQPAH